MNTGDDAMIRAYRNADIEAILYTWQQASGVAHHLLTDEFLAIERQNIRDKYIPAAETSTTATVSPASIDMSTMKPASQY